MKKFKSKIYNKRSAIVNQDRTASLESFVKHKVLFVDQYQIDRFPISHLIIYNLVKYYVIAPSVGLSGHGRIMLCHTNTQQPSGCFESIPE